MTNESREELLKLKDKRYFSCKCIKCGEIGGYTHIGENLKSNTYEYGRQQMFNEIISRLFEEYNQHMWFLCVKCWNLNSDTK